MSQCHPCGPHDVPPHDHYELRTLGGYGFTQTVPTWLANAEITVPPGDTPQTYAVPLHIPPGKACSGVAIALRGTASTTGTIRAALYQTSAAGGLLPIALSDPTTVTPSSTWHNAYFPSALPASDTMRKLYVVVSVGDVTDAYVQVYDPPASVRPFVNSSQVRISPHADLPVRLSFNTPSPWQRLDQIPLIALV